MHVEINSNNVTTGLLMTFPMPYGQRIRIAYYNPGTSQVGYVYSMVTYAPTALDESGGKRLRAQTARVLDQLHTRQPGDVTTFADISGGPGNIVYHQARDILPDADDAAGSPEWVKGDARDARTHPAGRLPGR
jgi:hypothetical protein